MGARRRTGSASMPTSNFAAKVNREVAASAPEGEIVDEGGKLSSGLQRQVEVKPELIGGDHGRNQKGEHKGKAVGHGSGAMARWASLCCKSRPIRAGHVGHPPGQTPIAIIPGRRARCARKDPGLVAGDDRP